MEEDWEVVGSEDGVEWEEIARSRSQSRSSSRSRPSTPTSMAALEAQLREAQERAARAEERAQCAEANAQLLTAQLLDARQHVLNLEVVVQQQRAENDRLASAILFVGTAPKPVHGKSRPCREKRVSKAMKNVAPQDMNLPKRKAWGKANHRTNMTSARHI